MKFSSRRSRNNRVNPLALTEVEKIKRILVKDTMRPNIPKNEPESGQLEYSTRVANNSLQASLDAENIQQLLPDTRKAKQILVSTILSPKDLITVNCIYSSDSEYLGEVSAEMIRLVEEDLEKKYKIKNKMKKHLDDILFDHGAHISVIIPKSRIDSLINNSHSFSNESYNEIRSGKLIPNFIGILGSNQYALNERLLRHQASNENYLSGMISPNVGPVEFGVTISDNIENVRAGIALAKMQEYRISQLTGTNYGLESTLDIDFNKRKSLFAKKEKDVYKGPTNRWYDRKLVLDIEENSTENETYDYDDTPLVYDIPPESFIPVHEPANPTNVIGGFILVDPLTGTPIRRNNTNDFLTYGQNPNLVNGGGSDSQMLGRMRSAMMDYGYINHNHTDADTMLRIYTGIIEEDVKRRLNNGISGMNAEMVKNDEVYRIMFARACAQQQTQLIYVSNRFLTYFAFDYDDRGVGISLLTQSKKLSTIRATVAMANFFATIRNSINYRKYTLELDENDPDPDETVETTIHEITRSTQQNMPMFEPNPTDIVNFIQNAGISIEVTGHPKWATTKVEMDNVQASNVEVDTDYVDRLQADHMGFLGVPAEAINSSLDVEFMRNIIQNHLLFTKSAMRYQDEYLPLLTQDVKKYIYANGKLLNKLKEVVHEKRDVLRRLGIKDSNSDNKIVNHFIDTFVIKLPEPDLTKIDIQMEEFNKYKEALELFLPAYISTDYLGDDMGMQLGELGGNVEKLIELVKADLLRIWLKERGVMPELADMFAEVSDDKPFNEITERYLIHREALIKILLPLVKKITKSNNLINEILENIDGEEGDDSSSSNDSDDYNDDDSGDDGDESSDDGDDFGSDFTSDEDEDFGSDDGGDETGSDEEIDDDLNGADTEEDEEKESSSDDPEKEEEDETEDDDKEEEKDEKDEKEEIDDDLDGFKG